MNILVTGRATAAALINTGHPIPINELPRRPGDSARLAASSEKVKCKLDWKPEHDHLQDTISSAWQWHQSHRRGFEGNKS
jgi:UDP-glucose 4-epimerase